jgi:hypothetical protein
MATLARPGVEITQVVTAAAPTVLTPTLVPCLVGPCFQIVEPLADGALNPQAAVSTAAILKGATAQAGLMNLSGKSLLLKINGVNKTVTFPAVAVGALFSKQQAVNVLNGQLEGATASFGSDNKILITTLVKGGQASLEVDTANPAQNNAASDLGFAAGVTRATGKQAYSGQALAFPFNNLPSPKADVNELTFLPDEIQMYRFYNNAPYVLSPSSAPNWTSYIPNTLANGTGVTDSTSSWRRHTLKAIPGLGAKSGLLAHEGTQASIRIPLQHNVGGVVKWPDVTGKNYLEVACVGAPLGKYIGAAGNAVEVEFEDDGLLGAGAVTASWDALQDRLTITHNSGTYANLTNALNSITGLSADPNSITVTLVKDPSLAGSVAAISDIADQTTFLLSGGEDPANFGTDPNSNLRSAIIRGAVKVESATTASDLSINNESLYISVDGGEYVKVTLTGVIATQLNGVPGLSASTVLVTSNDTSTVEVLQLVSDSAFGTDSTLEVRADKQSVIDALFQGFSSKTEVLTAAPTSGAWGNAANPQNSRKVVLTSGSGVGADYNLQADSQLEQAVTPGKLTLSFSGLTVAGFHAGKAIGTLTENSAELSVLVGSTQVDLSLGNLSAATPAQVVTALVAASVGNDPDKVGFRLIGTDIIVITNTTGTNASTIRLLGAATPSSSTTVGVETYLQTAGFTFDVDATTKLTGGLTLKDSTPSTYAWQVSAFAGNLFGDCKIANTITVDNSFVGSLVLDSGSGFEYSSGSSLPGTAVANSLTFAAVQNFAAPVGVAALYPLSVRLNGNTALSISYERVWTSALAGSVGISQSYGGKVFHGRPMAIRAGDTLYENGVARGNVVAIESSTYNGVTFDNLLQLSDPEAVSKTATLTNWYVVAQNLTSASTAPVKPELIINSVDQSLTVKQALNRGLDGVAVSGIPAQLYTGYRALRKDVSADSVNPALLQFANIAEVESVIGPIDTRNPLAFALYCAFLQTTNISISALGVGEVSADAPEGTVAGYTKALDFLELKEVYALTPLSQDPAVHQKFGAHCVAMSEPTGKLERIAFVNQALPTEKVPTLVVSGNATIGAGATATQRVLTFSDPSVNLLSAFSGKTDAGGSVLDPSAGFGPSNGVYVDRGGDAFKYLVVAVPTVNQIVIETDNIFGPGSGPGSSGNEDGFYRTAIPANFEIDGESCALYIRQAALNSATTGGKLEICNTLAEIAGGPAGYQSKRLYFIQPEKVGIEIAGVEQLVPGYYACAADAARVGQLSPSQPFTNLPYVGFSRVVGSSDKFSENQMATAAAGGVWWIVQDTPGGSLVSRHQLSTDLTSLKTRELSIIKSVDCVAKILRDNIKRFIGRNNITQQLLEVLGVSLGATLNSIIGSVVASASVDSIVQDPANPDTVAVEVSIAPFYPCNRIKITIFV